MMSLIEQILEMRERLEDQRPANDQDDTVLYLGYSTKRYLFNEIRRRSIFFHPYPSDFREFMGMKVLTVEIGDYVNVAQELKHNFNIY